jgi:glyoxylase-like metal-dependent hydrolase (beta-lactamase superfamily II)/8-oxo-dGTP pyrophosphatase MutT (NUDIX family)
MSPTLVPRDAATIMLVRDVLKGGEVTMQVLMLRRNSQSAWVGGAHLFPGGAVDPEDSSEAIAEVCAGRDDAEASRILGIESGGRSFFVAAVRECFEEAGILLALTGAEPLSFADPEIEQRFVEHRRRLNADEASLASICDLESLELDLDRVCYFSHWITPEGAPRRYDTRFFVGIVPDAQEALHDDSEVVASTWIEPADALARHRAGELDLMFPTVKNLEAISRFGTAGELMTAAAAAEVPAILPRLTVEGEGVRIVLPGDDGYEDATGLPPGVPFPDRPQPPSPAANAPAAVVVGEPAHIGSEAESGAQPEPRSWSGEPCLDPPVPGTPVTLLPGVIRLTAPNPSVMTGPGTNTYIVGHAALVAIDPGPDDETHLQAIADAAAGRLRAIIVTHTHPDHAPGAAGLARLTGARVQGFVARDGFEPDDTLAEQSLVNAGDIPLRAFHTPGHASNHLCYVTDLSGEHGESIRLLFSGDHIMGGSTVVIAPPDGDMAAYLGSLERLLGFDPPIDLIAPGHGPLLPDPRQVIQGYIDHRLAREAAIAASLGARGTAAIEEIVSDVYTDVPEALHPIARFSVWAHLRKLAADGRAQSQDPDDVSASWQRV